MRKQVQRLTSTFTTLLCKANILRFYSFLNLTAGDAYATQYVAPKWAHFHVRVCPWRKNLQEDIKNNLMHALPKIIFQIILIENRFFYNYVGQTEYKATLTRWIMEADIDTLKNVLISK